MKSNRESVANRLKIIKEELGLSLSKMAEQVGTTKVNLNSYMRGRSLPPVEVIEAIALLSGKSEDWIYYGEPEDFIREYLIFKGEDFLLESNPEIIEEIKKSFSKVSNIENIYLDQGMLKVSFSRVYKKYLIDYIEKLLSENKFQEIIEQNKLNPSNDTFYWRRFIEDVANTTLSNQSVVKYGDEARILKLAENEVKLRIEFLNDDWDEEWVDYGDDVIDCLIENFKTDEGTEKIITNALKEFNLFINFNTDKMRFLREQFQSLLPKLEEFRSESKKK